MAAINRFWKTVPLRSSILFFVGVFFIFTAIGFASDITEMGRQTTLRLVIGTFITGIFPVFYALSGFLLRKHFWKAMAPIFVVQFVLMDILANTYPSPPQPTQMDAATIARLQSRLSLDGSAIILVVVLGYACLTYVSVSESRRYARALAEIELATEIHGVLVPPIDFKIGGFEFLGRSVPSGEVGGDLIDVATSQDDWVAYLADVSGHGVAPGLVMGMVKSSARMLLSSAAGSGHLMARLNEVLYPLKKPDMFITFCFLAREGGVTRIGLAGHPPILHFSAATGTVTTCECPNMPLGILPEGQFASYPIQSQPGDLFALYTDGFIETANAAGEEFGLKRLQAELHKHAREPLDSIYYSLRESVARHGTQFDDQSILLIRHL
jgi:Stage II sporulation protein E (SpoIIE)